MPNDLTGLRVMVTRPASQVGSLLENLKAKGIIPFLFPLLEIRDYEPPGIHALLDRLADYDMLIFISPSAVQFGLNKIQNRHQIPGTIRLAAVGKGSARELEDRLGKAPDIYPQHDAGSEALLAEPEMHDIAGKKILIIRGRGGRELLAKTLTQRGAEVDYAEVYERCPPQGDTGPLETRIRAHQIDIILVTSRDALQNLCTIVNPELVPALRTIPILVIHPRQAEAVQNQGFIHPPILAHDGSDAAIIEALTSWNYRYD